MVSLKLSRRVFLELGPPILAIIISISTAIALEQTYGEGDLRKLFLASGALVLPSMISAKMRFNKLSKADFFEVTEKESDGQKGTTAAQKSTTTTAPPTTPAKDASSKTTSESVKWTPLAVTPLSNPTSALSLKKPDSAVAPGSPPKSKLSSMLLTPTTIATTITPSKTPSAVSAKKTTPGPSISMSTTLDDSAYNSPSSLVFQPARTPQTPASAGAARPNARTGDRQGNAASSNTLVVYGANTTNTGKAVAQTSTPMPPNAATGQQQQQMVSSTSKPLGAVNPLSKVDEDAARHEINQLRVERPRPMHGSELMDFCMARLKRALRDFMDKSIRQYDQLKSANIQSQNIAPQQFSLNAERVNLTKPFEQFFIVRRRENMVPFSRTYVSQRMRSLIADESLSKFIWNGGERFEEREWSAEKLPTDAEIIFHVFCSWMDSFVKRDERSPSFKEAYTKDCDNVVSKDQLKAEQWLGFLNCGQDVSFSELASLSSGEMFHSPSFKLEEGSIGGNQLQRTYRPHYKVVFNGDIIEVRSQRLNVFHAIILFLYKLRTANTASIDEIFKQVFGSI